MIALIGLLIVENIAYFHIKSFKLSNLTQNLIEEKAQMINAFKSFGGGKTILFKNNEKYFKNPSTRAEFIFDVIKTLNFEEIKKNINSKMK
jgi:hypothetical protein